MRKANLSEVQPFLTTAPHDRISGALDSASSSPAMERTAQQRLLRDVLLVAAGSLTVAVCARYGSVPLPFTPIPLSLQNFAVLLVGLTLGSRRGFASLLLYLMQGVAGLPVFSPFGPGGLAQLLGPTGGFLMAYPAVAFLAGLVFEKSKKTFFSGVIAGSIGELVLFTAGTSWLMAVAGVGIGKAVHFAFYPFFFAEVIKIMFSAALASLWHRPPRV